ncbi:MAG: OstA-like protein [Balneolales bacterium]
MTDSPASFLIKKCFTFMLLLSGFSLSGLFIIPDQAEAQNRVRILASDRLEGDQTDEGSVTKFIGNVKLETDDFVIVCDSAYQYSDLDELRAYGNIQIDMETETIWSDYAYYHIGEEISEFEGRVVMQGENATLFSDYVEYSFITKIATFPGSLRLEDEESVLLSDSGTYYNEQDSATFRGHVQMADSVQYIEADSLFTNRSARYYELFGDVFLDDFENRVRLSGDYVEADSTGQRTIEGSSRMRRINESETDTTHINAHRMEVLESDTTYTFKGFTNVEIWTPDYSSLSDTANYDDHLELFTLEGSPSTWYNNIQLTGPRIEIQLQDDAIRSLLSYIRSFSVQEDTLTGRLNQVTGDTIYVNFEDDQIDYIDVTNQSSIFYHTKDEERNPDGAVEMSARFIKMIFLDGELEDVNSYENITGTFFQESSSLESHELEGFVWEPDRRPQRPPTEIEKRLGDIPVERPFSLPRRYLESQE